MEAVTAEFVLLLHYADGVCGRNSRTTRRIEEGFFQQMEDLGYFIGTKETELRKMHAAEVLPVSALLVLLEPQLYSWMMAETGEEHMDERDRKTGRE